MLMDVDGCLWMLTAVHNARDPSFVFLITGHGGTGSVALLDLSRFPQMRGLHLPSG